MADLSTAGVTSQQPFTGVAHFPPHPTVLLRNGVFPGGLGWLTAIRAKTDLQNSQSLINNENSSCIPQGESLFGEQINGLSDLNNNRADWLLLLPDCSMLDFPKRQPNDFCSWPLQPNIECETTSVATLCTFKYRVGALALILHGLHSNEEKTGIDYVLNRTLSAKRCLEEQNLFIDLHVFCVSDSCTIYNVSLNRIYVQNTPADVLVLAHLRSLHDTLWKSGPAARRWN